MCCRVGLPAVRVGIIEAKVAGSVYTHQPSNGPVVAIRGLATEEAQPSLASQWHLARLEAELVPLVETKW